MSIPLCVEILWNNNDNQKRGKCGRVGRRRTLPPTAIIIINKLFARLALQELDNSGGSSIIMAGARVPLHRKRTAASGRAFRVASVGTIEPSYLTNN